MFLVFALKATTQAKNQVKGRLLLDVVIGEGTAIFELFSSKNKSLLVWGDTLLVLDLGLDVLNRVRGFHLKGDGLSRQSLNEDLHTSTEPEHQVESRFLLNVVVAKSAPVFKLLSSKNKSLLVWGDTLLVLDLGLDVLNRIRSFDFQGNGLACKRLDEDLHTTTKAKYQMECRLLLDVVVAKSAAILELFSGEDKSLLVWGDTLLVLDLGLHVLDSVRSFHLKGDGLAGQSLHEDLHTSTETKYEMKGRLFLDVVVAKSAAILELFSSEDKSLLVWGDALLVLDLGLDVFDSVGGLDFEGDGLTGQSLDENLHVGGS